MKKIIIGIQGAKGSFSEEAAEKFIQNYNIAKFEIQYLISSELVLRNVENSKIDYGIFAMENAQGGVVIESVEALAKYRCNIVEMFHISVNQCLLAKKNMTLGDIREIHSHPQALRQCKNYLAENFWTRKLVESDDTAEAARRLGSDSLPPNIAVIGSESCAKLYGLEVLEDGIHDLKNNLTLFLSIKRL